MLLVLGLAFSFGPLAAQDAAKDLIKSNFESSVPDYNPWGGVTDAGLIKVLAGKQPAVNDSGKTRATEFGPSVATGDLNGDGLEDMMIGDSRGFFWYFPNSGKPGAPAFTHGEITPIWLGFHEGDEDEVGGRDGANNVVPKIQLVDYAKDGKLSLVVGNYVGRLFYIANQGSGGTPAFPMPRDRGTLIVPTRKNGQLWTNFISPFAYDWHKSGNLDLLIGDGSYSANSIYLLTNKGSRDRPIFNQDNTIKLIPGMGREHLTPQVVDWNNDGKPDVIAGERTGYINLFRNTTPDNAADSTFAEGEHLKFGGKDDFGELTTVTINDLPGNKLPNVIITNTKGEILYGQNTGTPGSPQFGALIPMKGVMPYPKIARPIGWTLSTPPGIPHELLVCTNATVQPGFTPPPGTAFKNALRYFVFPVVNTYFKDFYYPVAGEEDEHRIIYNTGFQIRENVDYKVSFWVRSNGVKKLAWRVRGWANLPDDGKEEVVLSGQVPVGNSWRLFEDTFRFKLKNAKTTDNLVGVNFDVYFFGQGDIYLDDVWVRAAQ